MLKLFRINQCTHPNVQTNRAMSYCPDCGELIKINWYIVKCKCCNKKRIGIVKDGKIIPLANYCSNCGSNEYILGRIENINYFDMNFAIAAKETEKNNRKYDTTQIWVDEKENTEEVHQLKLLPQYN
ncbi:MAG: hypothetical protein PHX18_03270 [Candidatus Gastranaerophilales bacterium]|nr:hypothetical protein [Candidatus Gastranaerophilales bacterium]